MLLILKVHVQDRRHGLRYGVVFAFWPTEGVWGIALSCGPGVEPPETGVWGSALMGIGVETRGVQACHLTLFKNEKLGCFFKVFFGKITAKYMVKIGIY